MFITGENVSFRYTREKAVLDDVSFALHKSHTLSIVGASGCGKSTLLRIISGILPNAKDNRLSGKVSINGQTPDEYRRSGKLAFMFQESTLMPNLTVRQNITLPLKIKGLEDNEKVNGLLRIVGLTDYADYLPKHLSGGMKTRVALARSFATGPQLLLLDEPFSALDIAWKRNLYIELEKLREQYHTTVVFVTHDVQEALLLSNQLIVMSHTGRVKECHQVQSSKALVDRVYDIPGFMNEIYADYLIPIQSSIMSDGYKDSVSYKGKLPNHESLTMAPEGKLKDEKASALRNT